VHTVKMAVARLRAARGGSAFVQTEIKRGAACALTDHSGHSQMVGSGCDAASHNLGKDSDAD
jgi:hypothetical protein